MIFWDYWYLFFAGMFVATFANLIGAGGSKFFSPLYMYFIGLSPLHAIVSALVTQSFGFGSGSFAYFQQKQIDFPLARKYLLIAIPMAILGAFISHQFSMSFIEITFGFVLIINSIAILFYDQILWHLRSSKWGMIYLENTVLFLGSMFLGLISVGLGELITPTFLLRYKFPTQRAVGTSVFIVFVSTVFSALTHIIILYSQGDPFWNSKTISVLIWMIPGAMLGAQIGSRISAKVSSKNLKKILTFAFIVLGLSILINRWIHS